MEKHFCRGLYNRWNSLITVSHNSASLGKYKGQFTTVQLQSTTSFQLWPREYLSLLWTKAWIQGKEIFYYIENISWGRMRMHFIDVQIETLTKGHSLSVIRKLFSNVLYSIAYSDIWVLYVMISTYRYHVNPFVNVLRYSRKKIIRRRYRYGWKNKVLKVWEYNQKWYSSHLLRVVITVGVCNDRTICCHTSERHLLQPHIWKLWQSQTHMAGIAHWHHSADYELFWMDTFSVPLPDLPKAAFIVSKYKSLCLHFFFPEWEGWEKNASSVFSFSIPYRKMLCIVREFIVRLMLYNVRILSSYTTISDLEFFPN